MPESLEQLAGPAGGVVVLPGRLDWSTWRCYDLSENDSLRIMFEQVTQEGREEDLGTVRLPNS